MKKLYCVIDFAKRVELKCSHTRTQRCVCRMIDVLINSVVEILSQHIAVVLATQSCLTLGDSKDCQAPLSMEFSRQEHWNVPSPGYLPDPGIKPRPPTLQADSLLSEPPAKPRPLAHSISFLETYFLAHLKLPFRSHSSCFLASIWELLICSKSK